MRRISRLGISLLSALLLAFVMAQSGGAQGVTTSAVTGQVTGPQGEPLEGIQITVTNIATGAVQRVVTRDNGRYLLPGLPPGGPYRIEAGGAGYAAKAVEGVNLAISQTQEFDFSLSSEAVALEGLTVTADAGNVISKDRMGTTTVVEDSAISRLPTITRDFTDFVRLSPQISTGGAGASAAGRNNRFNTIQIDGAANNDLFGLSASGTPGGQAATKPISLDAIQEFQVVISPMDVRQGGFTGAGINAVTKSGTNEFHGALFYYNKNDALVGDYVDLDGDQAPDFADFSQQELGFSLGGPIVEDRLHFFINGEVNRRSAPIGEVAGVGSVRVSLEEAQRVADILRDQYGFEPGEIGALDLDRNSDLAFGRLDWNINPDHRLTLRHNYVDAFDDNLSRSNTTYPLGGYLYAFNSVTNATVAQLNSNFGNRFFNELRLGYTTVRDQRQVSEEVPSVRVFLDQERDRSIRAGTDQFSGQNALNQDVFELTNDLTFAVGPHNFTVGTHNEFFEFDNLFVRNAFGYYEFDSPEALIAGDASRFEYSYLLEGGEPRANFPVRQWAFYGQDQLTVTDDFTLTAGLRYDLTTLPKDPAFNPVIEEFFVRNTAEVPTSGLFNPRLGFNWDVTGNQTTQLRGGTGLFSGRTPGVWLSNAYGNTGREYVRFTCTGSAAPDFVADPDAQPQSCAGSTRLTPNEINTIDPDFEAPQVWRSNLALDQELPFGFVGTLEGLYTATVQDVSYRDLSIAPDPSGATVEGRPLYRSRFTSAELPTVGNIFEITNTDEGYSYSLTAGLEKPFTENWSANGSYTYSQAQDVNSLTSSQASSNFRFLPIGLDPNNPALSTSNFEVPHRVVLSASYQAEWLRRAATNISLIYIGESGRPYSFIYNGDINRDGQRSNDLVFVPADASQIRFAPATDAAGVVTVTPEQSFENLNVFINSVDCLREARGEILDRNACREPWQNRLDVRVSQNLPTFRGQTAQVTLDILNFANLLNEEWGRNRFVSFGTDNLLSVARGGRAENGRQLFEAFRPREEDDVLSLGDLSSRYQIQLGLRYEF